MVIESDSHSAPTTTHASTQASWPQRLMSCITTPRIQTMETLAELIVLMIFDGLNLSEPNMMESKVHPPAIPSARHPHTGCLDMKLLQAA